MLADDAESIRDEFILGTDMNKISVRGVLSMKNMMKDNEDNMNIEAVSYGTPK